MEVVYEQNKNLETETVKQNQRKSGVKNYSDYLKNSLEQILTGKNISKYEDMSFEIIESEEQEKSKVGRVYKEPMENDEINQYKHLENLRRIRE